MEKLYSTLDHIATKLGCKEEEMFSMLKKSELIHKTNNGDHSPNARALETELCKKEESEYKWNTNYISTLWNKFANKDISIELDAIKPSKSDVSDLERELEQANMKIRELEKTIENLNNTSALEEDTPIYINTGRTNLTISEYNFLHEDDLGLPEGLNRVQARKLLVDNGYAINKDAILIPTDKAKGKYKKHLQKGRNYYGEMVESTIILWNTKFFHDLVLSSEHSVRIRRISEPSTRTRNEGCKSC